MVVQFLFRFTAKAVFKSRLIDFQHLKKKGSVYFPFFVLIKYDSPQRKISNRNKRFVIESRLSTG